MQSPPALRPDGIPYKTTVFITVMAFVFTLIVFGEALVNNAVLYVCTIMLMVDDTVVSVQTLPIMLAQSINVGLMYYVGRMNARVYKQFDVDSLDVRIQLKRNMATSDALTASIGVVAAANALVSFASEMCAFFDLSTAFRHHVGHVAHAVVVTMKMVFAVMVMSRHKRLRNTVRYMMRKVMMKMKCNVETVNLEMEMAEMDTVEDNVDNTNPLRFYASLAKAWGVHADT